MVKTVQFGFRAWDGVRSFFIVHLHTVVDFVQEEAKKLVSVLLTTRIKFEATLMIAEQVDNILWLDIVDIFAN